MEKIFNHNWERAVAQGACRNIAQMVLEMDVSDVEVPKSLTERVSRLIADESAHFFARKRLMRKRIMIAIIAAIIVALTACMTIPAIREKLYKIVITYHDKYFTYKSEPIDSDETELDAFTTSDGRDTEVSSTETVPVTETTAPLFVKKLPTYIPEGYELYMDLSAGLMIHMIYYNANDGSMVSYEQYFVGKGTYKFDSENAEVRDVMINDILGMAAITLTGDATAISLLWNDGVYDYFVNTSLNLEESLKIAESIQ